VLIQNITMLEVWNSVLAQIEALTGITSYAVIFTVAFAVAVSVPVGLLALASRIAASRNLDDTKLNFARFGYALIPLDVAAHLAHNLFHLLAEGGSVYYTVGALVGVGGTGGDPALMSTGAIQVLQFALLALGVAGSLYTARRIAHRRYRTASRRRSTLIPYVAIIVLLGAINVWMFLLPMAHRM
ncbi:4Fe-4S binding protein, partial [Cellulomonas humilata]|nr:4Fe-4S binding protein [Cellulomonas humilata]